MEKAVIFDIQRNSFVDGPGIRTTVFFKGCNLACRWCHNPESQSDKTQILFYKDKCRACGRCSGVAEDDCDFICFNDARNVCGKEYTTEAVFDEIVKDKLYFEVSGGGVTFSGGECMLKIDFLCEMLKMCRKSGIHTAVDTAGNVPWEYFERVIPYTDLFLYDLKAFTPELHKAGTGVDNARIIDNFKKLSSKSKIIVRIPIIGGFNDSLDEMNRIALLVKSCGNPSTELLPYHAMGEHKYSALNRKCESFYAPSDKTMCELRRLFE